MGQWKTSFRGKIERKGTGIANSKDNFGAKASRGEFISKQIGTLEMQKLQIIAKYIENELHFDIYMWTLMHRIFKLINSVPNKNKLANLTT